MKKRLKLDDTGAEEGLVTDVLGDDTPAETPAAETAAPAQDETKNVDDALETAKQTEAALTDKPDDEPAHETSEAETVPAEQYAAALKRVETLEARVQQLVELATVNARNNASLTQRIIALEGEPVVSDSIGGMKQFSTPKLPSLTTLRKPTHVSQKVQAQGQPAAAASNPALASLAASQARQTAAE